uniref:Uncharacterized protein n=1 Tax=Arundo donax TaxID=35708 RepID=A0A0A9A3G3_ARUDO
MSWGGSQSLLEEALNCHNVKTCARPENLPPYFRNE